MECCEPGAIRDEELIAFLDKEPVRSAVIEHLARCQACSSRVAAYQKLEHNLTSKLYRWDCPSNHMLGEYQLGLLDSEQITALEVHLGLCVLCSAELETLKAFLSADPLLDVPVSAASQVASAHVHMVPETKTVVQLVRERVLTEGRRILARLLPPPQPGLAFQRGSGPQTLATAWPRDYQAEDISISLQLEPDPRHRGTFQLIGFIARRGQAIDVLQGVTVQLSASGQSVATQSIDELGNVVFSALSPTDYTLEFVLPDGLVVVVEQISVSTLP